jgi:hypothetical protein
MRADVYFSESDIVGLFVIRFILQAGVDFLRLGIKVLFVF